MSSEISKLVKAAQGNRSLRQYAKDSGVNVSIISKIINGTYIPGPEIIKKLTSEKAKPENGITESDMLRARNDSEAYRSGMKAGEKIAIETATIGGAFALALGINPIFLPAVALASAGRIYSNVKNAEEIKKKEELERRLKHFIASARGLIYEQLVDNGIPFKQVRDENLKVLNNENDIYLKTEQCDFDEMIYRFLYFPKKVEDGVIDLVVKNCLGELLFIPYDSKIKRKITIIVNSNELYKEIIKYKGNLSFRGCITAIRFDNETIKFVGEEVVLTEE